MKPRSLGVRTDHVLPPKLACLVTSVPARAVGVDRSQPWETVPQLRGLVKKQARDVIEVDMWTAFFGQGQGT